MRRTMRWLGGGLLLLASTSGVHAATVITGTMADAELSNGGSPLTVFFTGSSPGAILHEWDFDGDGTFDFASTTSGNTAHTYSSPGQFAAVFRVTDSNGLTDFGRAPPLFIQVGAPGTPSVVASAVPQFADAPLNVNLFGSGTGGTIVLFEWDFDGDGTFDFSSPTTANTAHFFATEGLYYPRLRVTNSDGKSSSDVVELCLSCTIVGPPIPLPAAAWLFGSALMGLPFIRRRQH